MVYDLLQLDEWDVRHAYNLEEWLDGSEDLEGVRPYLVNHALADAHPPLPSHVTAIKYLPDFRRVLKVAIVIIFDQFQYMRPVNLQFLLDLIIESGLILRPLIFELHLLFFINYYKNIWVNIFFD